jgi:hypothetical protein
MTSTNGTYINWRMMERVIKRVNKIEYLVGIHDAGEYSLGTSST